MANELLKSVMNNISKKNLDGTNYSRSRSEYRNLDNFANDAEDKYEIQKNLSLSKYNSNKQDTKVKDLNALADEIRGRSKQVNNSEDVRERRVSNKNNTLTLDELSKLAGSKSDKDDKTTKSNINYTKNTNNGKFSLDSLTDKIKKNI